MNASDADRQIKQMVNFILQEAHEKANEIRIKTEHDFNLEKQMLVHNAKIKIQEEYARKEKEREINKRIARSAEIGASRRKKMIARDELLKTLIAEGQGLLKNLTTDENKCKALLRDLIVQGLIKLVEPEVVIAVRAKDVRLAESVLKEATDKYVAVMKKEANMDVAKVKVTLNKVDEGMVAAAKSGGVILYAKQGKIVCDNTLDTRLDTVYYDLKPTVRKMLFPVA
jgi:V-type H+-transporting ATPase subunit E